MHQRIISLLPSAAEIVRREERISNVCKARNKIPSFLLFNIESADTGGASLPNVLLTYFFVYLYVFYLDK